MIGWRKLFLWFCAAAVFITAGCHEGGLTKKYYYTRTDDGITLAMRRYQLEKSPADKPVVILCHGLSYNLLFWDLHREVSLAKYLARAGYDVWSLSLRGASPSSQPLNSALRKLGHFELSPEALKTIQNRIGDLKMINWSVDDHIRHDVPAAIRFVQEQSGCDQLHWIGHSMGGMVMFAHLQQIPAGDTSAVKSFVAVSVPMNIFHPLSKPLQFLLKTRPALHVGSHIIGSSAPATWGVIFGNMGTPMNKLFYNVENMNNEVLRELFRRAEEEVSPGQLSQLLNMVRSEHFQSLDGKVDYTQGLGRVSTPTYFLVGTVDNLATVGAVRYAYRQTGSQDKKFGLFGRVNSHINNYGHDDIIIGKHAKKEVYPTILKWLNEHNK